MRATDSDIRIGAANKRACFIDDCRIALADAGHSLFKERLLRPDVQLRRSLWWSGFADDGSVLDRTFAYVAEVDAASPLGHERSQLSDHNMTTESYEIRHLPKKHEVQVEFV